MFLRIGYYFMQMVGEGAYHRYGDTLTIGINELKTVEYIEMVL